MQATELFEKVKIEDGESSEFPLNLCVPTTQRDDIGTIASRRSFYYDFASDSIKTVQTSDYLLIPFHPIRAKGETPELARNDIDVLLEKAALRLLYAAGFAGGVVHVHEKSKLRPAASVAIRRRFDFRILNLKVEDFLNYGSHVLAASPENSLVHVFRDDPICWQTRDEWVAEYECGLGILDHRHVALLKVKAHDQYPLQ